uniref:POLQ-like helical domain-containing protein n=1 Tax=Plectus sambesii TaxID=2011161 RepID=A0A914VGY9_9BILA
AICSGIALEDDSLMAFAKTTLMASQWTDERTTLSDNIRFLIKQCTDYLLEKLFVNREDGVFSATQLGTAALVSALGAEDSLAVFADLSQAQRSLSLDNELHMLYLVSSAISFYR